MKHSTLNIRVYYEDTDWGGVVYYANYLRYAEAARTEYLRERSINLAELHRSGIMFVVVEAHARYRAPARYDDLLELQTCISEHTSLTLTFETKVYNQHHKHLVTVTARLACIGADGQVERIPANLISTISGDGA